MIDYIIMIIISLILIIGLAIIFKIDIKKIKEIGNKKELNELAKKYPSNVQICQKILKMLNNENVEIEEDLNAKNCLYIVLSNKIIIADTKESYTRIQTVVHECIHSIQDKRIQLFNFIYSNIYLIYYLISIILIILKICSNNLIYISIYLILGLIYYTIRNYLETDAMINARYLANEYMEKENILSAEDNLKIIEGFDEINTLGIKCANFSLIVEILLKVTILSIVALIF